MALLRLATRPYWAGLLFQLFLLACSLCLIQATACLLTPSYSFAAVGVSISGVVCDSSGAPIQGATIASLEFGKSTTSDINGKFELPDLPTGQHHLLFTRLGYNPLQIGPLSTHEGYQSPLQARMTAKSILLSPVDVFGKIRNGIVTDGITATISRKDWDNIGVHTVAEVLRLIPAVTIREGDHVQRISLRGSPPRSVHVDLDGIPLNDPGTGEADISTVPLASLEEVAVQMSGDGGNVHLSTLQKKRADRQSGHWSLNSGTGSHSKNDGAFEVEKEGRSLGGRLNFGVFEDAGDFEYQLDDGTKLKRYNNRESKRLGDGRLSFRSESVEYETGLYFSRVNRGVPGLIYSAATPEARYDTERLAGRASVHYEADKSGVEVMIHAQSQEGEFQSPAKQFDPAINDTVYNLPEWNRQTAERYGAGLNSMTMLGSVEVSGRYSWQLDRYIGRDLFTGRVDVGGVGFGKAERQTHHLDFMAKKQILRGSWNYSVAPAVGVDFIEDRGIRSTSHLTPSMLALAAHQGERFTTTTSLGWSRSVNPPPFNALFTVESMVATGNKNLRAEKGESFVVSSSVEPVMKGYDCEATLSLFRRETKDYIVWRRNAWGKYYPDNLGSARFTGAEVSGRIQPISGVVRLWFNYIYNRSRNITPGSINNGNAIPLTPLHSGSSGLTGVYNKTSVTAEARWVGRQFASESNLDPISTAGMGLPAYSVYDLSAIQKVPFSKVECSVEGRIENLFDTSYRVIERSPMPGRTYWLRLSVEAK